jgi:OFA family oxalate/formate antiporter-like MFS transporter
VALGLILSSRTTTLWGFIIGFGLFVGAGIGFGYASATPPALKWFPAAKTGLISGIVVSGFGLASVYAAPLATYLMNQFGIQTMLLILGIAFFFLVVGLAQVIKAPPPGFLPAGTAPAKSDPGSAVKKEDFTPKEMLGTLQFYMLWFMYACGAGAGLMVISKLSAIAKIQANIELGFILVAVLAIGNGGGRILAGMLSDKIGRKNTLLLCFVLQAIMVFLLSRAIQGSVLATVPMLVVVSALIGACYGANLSVFPSVAKDFYGLKNFGVNYGFIFTAWGVGGFSLSLLAGNMYDITKSFNVAYYGASGLLILAAIMTFFLKSPHRVETGDKKGK